MIETFKREPVYYLAAPYTHSDESVKKDRLNIVLNAAFDLIQKGYLIYSPLTHNTPIDALGIFGDFETWSRSDHNMLYRSDGLFVLTLKGWETSKGVAAEMNMAKQFGLSIQFIEWKAQLKTTSVLALSKTTP